MKKTLLSIVLIVMLLATIFVLTGCENTEEGIIGSWSTTYSGAEYIYTFNKDKTGMYSYGKTSINFKYEDNGSELSILYDGGTTPGGSYKYRIEENKLIVKDSFGKDVEYIRK